MSTPFRVRVEIYNNDASYGPGQLAGIFDNAKRVGVSSYANDAGEFFMTLPYNHPAISVVKPFETHWRVLQRLSDNTTRVIGSGFVDDFRADKNELTFYGSDYMGLLSLTITSASTTYTSQPLGTIVNSQLTLAQSNPDGRMAFTTVGTIESTSKTATLVTAFQERLDFLRGVADVSMSDRSVRTILSIGREATSTGAWEFNFRENQGSLKRDIWLIYGKQAADFQYSPGFSEFATSISGVGIKRQGAAVLYSTQTYASNTYGAISRTSVHQNVDDQAALDDLVKRDARRAARIRRYIVPVVKQGSVRPWDGWDLGDTVLVSVNRGAGVVVEDHRTIWGMEWVVEPNGRENLYLQLEPEEI